MMPSLEEEIKLVVSSDARLEAVVADVGHRMAPVELLFDRSYVDLYLDSPDYALLTHGLALRLRTRGPERWVELKGFGTVSLGVARRLEWRQLAWPGDLTFCRDLTDGPVRTHLLTFVAEETPLVELFECKIARRCMKIPMSENGLAEIAFDRGEVRAGKQCMGIREVEVERLAGSIAPIVDFAHDLARRHGLELVNRSKFSAGLSLLGWKIPG